MVVYSTKYFLFMLYFLCCQTKDKIIISVIVPAFNVENYVAKCLSSILNQTLRSLQVICVDDGSKDNTLQILNSFLEKDNRVVVIHQQNCGVSCACNVGLATATGDYVTFVHADDFLTDIHAYEIVFKAATDGDFDIIQWGYLLQNENNKSMFVCSEDKVFTGVDAARSLMPHIMAVNAVWSRMYKGSFLRNSNVTFDKRTRIAEDLLFNFDLVPFVDSILCMHKIFYHYNPMQSGLGGTTTDTEIYNLNTLISSHLGKMLSVNTCKNCVSQSDVEELKLHLSNQRVSLEKVLKKQNKEKKMSHVVFFLFLLCALIVLFCSKKIKFRR